MIAKDLCKTYYQVLLKIMLKIDKSECCINNCEECKVIHREKYKKKYCRECKQKNKTFSEFGNYY